MLQVAFEVVLPVMVIVALGAILGYWRGSRRTHLNAGLLPLLTGSCFRVVGTN